MKRNRVTKCAWKLIDSFVDETHSLQNEGSEPTAVHHITLWRDFVVPVIKPGQSFTDDASICIRLIVGGPGHLT